MAQDDYQTIRIWKSTLANLRKIYGLTDGEKMVEIVDRLVKIELERLEASRDGGAREGVATLATLA